MINFLLLVPANFLACGAVIFCLDWVTAIPWRKAAAAHWTEQARLLSPVRVANATNTYLVPTCLTIAEGLRMNLDTASVVVLALAGFLGAIVAGAALQMKIYPRFTFRAWLRLATLAWTLRAAWWGVLAIAAILMPERPGIGMEVIGAAVLLYCLAWNFGLLTRTLRVMGMLLPADQRLKRIVGETCRRLNVSEPPAWLLEAPLAQAFALATTRELIFTTRLMEVLSDGEVSLICAHELAHLTESKGVLALRIVGTFTFYPLIFVKPAIDAGPLAVCAVVGWMLVFWQGVLKLSRRMEVRADKMAAESQREEGGYACALEILYRDALIPAVNSSNRQSHPHLYDRMVAAGIQPDYPRPAKPGIMAWTGYLVPLALGVLIGISLAER